MLFFVQMTKAKGAESLLFSQCAPLKATGPRSASAHFVHINFIIRFISFACVCMSFIFQNMLIVVSPEQCSIIIIHLF